MRKCMCVCECVCVHLHTSIIYIAHTHTHTQTERKREGERETETLSPYPHTHTDLRDENLQQFVTMPLVIRFKKKKTYVMRTCNTSWPCPWSYVSRHVTHATSAHDTIRISAFFFISRKYNIYIYNIYTHI